MSAADIRPLLLARLAGLTLNNIYQSERNLNATSAFKTTFVTDGKVRGGWVRRKTRQDSYQDSIHDTKSAWHLILIEGFHEESESELIIDARIDAVIESFVGNPELAPGVFVHGDDDAGIRLLDQSPAMFGSVLIHLATIELTVMLTR